MSDALSALFQKFIDTINTLKWPIFVGLTILGILYINHFNFVGISSYLDSYSGLRPVFFLFWLFSGVLCLFSFGMWVKQTFTNFGKQQADIRQAQIRLHHLTQEQKRIVSRLLQPDQSLHFFQRTISMEDLEAEDIVRATGTPEPGYDGLYVPSWTPYLYILQDLARDYLTKHPELLQSDDTLKKKLKR